MTNLQKRGVNARKEHQELYGTRSQQHKKWKNIARELSDREITLSDIADPDSPKQKGLMELFSSEKMTLGDLTVLRQYSEAIVNGSTKAAEFLRATMGEDPKTMININDDNPVGLSQMTLDELLEMKELLKKNLDK